MGMTAVATDDAGTETIDLRKDLADLGVVAILDELDRDLVGLRPVKQRIREIAALLLVERARRRLGRGEEAPTLHMSFTGNPGTGKTTVALRMADILHRLGYIRRPSVVSVTRDDLVGQYIGHTAPKTKEALKKATGGVLFIDEAYYLYRPENERDYGQEAIEILLQVMENQRDDLVVIVAGYADRIETFFGANPGFRSRIAHHIDFPDYTTEELFRIAGGMLARLGLDLTGPAEEALREYIGLRRSQPHFANARSIRNALDRPGSARRAGSLPRRAPSRPPSCHESSRKTSARAVCSKRPHRSSPICAPSTRAACNRSPTSSARRRSRAVSVTGGHLGAGLGVVELTVALHLCLRHAARPVDLGRRPSGLSAQDPHRPARPHSHACARAAACPASPNAPRANTTVRRGAFFDFDFRRAWQWRWPAISQGEKQRRRGDRRRRDVGRHGL
jgi:probable Rubsico expression protein CbbX